MVTHIYGYFESINDFRFSTIKKWERKTLASSAKKYLQNHLLKSLKDDFLVALQTFKRRGVGYFALPRIIFPYIAFLGLLYTGKDGTESALKFMIDYMGRISKEYEYLSGIYYVGYRHGLSHTNMPKIFSFGGKKLGWQITYAKAALANRGDHLRGNLLLYPKLFYTDLYRAIELYIADFDNSKKQKRLLNNFKLGFIEMSKVYPLKEVPVSKLTKTLLRRGLKRYSV